MSYVLTVRNVNQAFSRVMLILDHGGPWRKVSPRGMYTKEWNGPFITDYEKPRERVLFNSVRDCNPFFHFFESLWILAGRDDVALLAQLNPRMREYSDNGLILHAPYGARLRGAHHFDQVLKVVEILRADRDTRQCVLTIWMPQHDLGAKVKDVPCNDMIFLKIRDGKLNMTVCCRSNDIIWGAYGANAVHFSVLQELIALAVGVEVGTYTQVSDSFHVYTDNEVYKRLQASPESGVNEDSYYSGIVTPYPLIAEGEDYHEWLLDLEEYLRAPFEHNLNSAFIAYVAHPLMLAWRAHKIDDFETAVFESKRCAATDWRLACVQWLERRRQKRAQK